MASKTLPGLETNSKIVLCEVCGSSDAKYTCPKCEVRTCSLNCVNIHKKELECDGVRNKTKFIYVPDFGNMDLLNDYKLLEETSRFVYGKQRDKSKMYTNFNKDLPMHLMKLKYAARKRGTIILYLLGNFSRHKRNSTRLNFKENKIYWLVEWIFVNSFPTPTKVREDKCDEDERMAKILDKYFDSATQHENVSKKNLNFYQSAGLNGCRFLLQAERIKGCEKKFHELDPRLSLKENLSGKCIIEYPSILVVLKDHSYDLTVVDSDEEISEAQNIKQSEINVSLTSKDNLDNKEENTNRESFTVTFAKRKKLEIQNEIASMKKNQPKNYLFPSEYSSEED